MGINLIILAHPDDEIFILPYILKYHINEENKYIYLTDGGIKNSERRRIEALKLFNKLSIKKEDIWFVGHDLGIRDGDLHNSLYEIVHFLVLKISAIVDIKNIITPIYEGGHQDHDSCCFIAAEIKNKLGLHGVNLLGFSLYHGENCFWKFFKVLTPLRRYKSCIKYKVPFASGFFYLRLIFFYPSQFRTFLGLFPQYFYRMIMLRTLFIIDFSGGINFDLRPHPGTLLYERYNRLQFKDFYSAISNYKNK